MPSECCFRGWGQPTSCFPSPLCFLSLPSRMRAPSSPPAPTLTPHSLSPGLCQSQAGGRRYVLLAGKESQSEREEAEMLAWRGCLFFFFFSFPQPCSQRREVWGQGVGSSGRAPKNRQTQPFPGGPGVRPPPRSICLSGSLCHPALPAQRSRGQRAGIPGRASSRPARGGTGLLRRV